MIRRSFVNGILTEDGKKVFAVGQSYFPSFHPLKMPVPPEGDQTGEMERDLEDIRKAGFNLLRTAANGKLSVENGKVSVEMPLVDRMMAKGEELGLSMQVRIQGYSVNVNGWKNTAMIRSDGRAACADDWANFMLDSLHHAGIQADNRAVTHAISGHLKTNPGIVSFVTYNEPHYPGDGIYDYHPSTVEAYRRYLVSKGKLTSAEAKDFEPPHCRPNPGESPDAWIEWRVFQINSMTDFLIESSKIARNEAPGITMLTCFTVNLAEFDNAVKGVDYFRSAEEMDVLGLTLYKNAAGGDYATTSLILASAESAAALCGKHFHLVEMDAATNIPFKRFCQQNLLALGMGTKCLMFYQWRGDYPFPRPDTPEPDGFGFVFNNRTKTDHYEGKVSFVRMLNELSPYLVETERIHSACGILFSHHAAMYCDAVENAFDDIAPRHRLGSVKNIKILHNSCMANLRRIYAELQREGIQSTLLEARHLKDNVFGVKNLYVPYIDRLSPDEQKDVLDFQKRGGMVFIPADDIWQPGLLKCGYEILGMNKTKYDASLTLAETLEISGIKPLAEVSSRDLALEWTGSEKLRLCMTIPVSSLHDIVSGAEMKVSFPYSKAVWHGVDGTKKELSGNPIALPDIRYGGVIVFDL